MAPSLSFALENLGNLEASFRQLFLFDSLIHEQAAKA
jgi:hypothetical protein